MKYDYDAIIIGSGFGGSVSALRLSEKNYTVGIMEMGKRWSPETLPKSNWQIWNFLWRPALGLKGFFSLRIFRHVMVMHGNAVGGGSVTYANTLLTPPDTVWSKGSWASLDNWVKTMPEFYQTAKRTLGVTENKRLGPADIALKTVADAEGVGDTFYHTDVGVFFGDKDDHEGGRRYEDPYFDGQGPVRHSCIACGACMTGCKYNAKNSLDKNYLYLAEKLGTKVHEKTKVTDVRPLLGANGEEGYEIFTEDSMSFFNKSRKRFTCKKVVFSGGALGTLPLLFKLKQSGSMPEISEQLGKQVRTNAESLLAVRIPKGEDMSQGIAIGSGVYIDQHTHVEAVRYGGGQDLLSLIFTPLTNGTPGVMRVVHWFLACAKLILTKPLVFLSSVNPRGFARQSIIFLCMQTVEGHLNMRWHRPWYFPFFKTLSTEGDRIPTYIPAANKFVERAAKLLGGVGASTVFEIFLNIPGTAHCMGGCAMAENSQQGVIDGQNRLFGYSNAYVCDGSMLGSNLGVNPSLTITALTERAMSFIRTNEA